MRKAILATVAVALLMLLTARPAKPVDLGGHAIAVQLGGESFSVGG